MGCGKSESLVKAPKTNAAQERAPSGSSAVAASVYPDWSNFQAYPPVPPQGFYRPPVGSSPQAHTYMWGVQNLVPPYGSPPPPYLMYPPRGLYAHPSIPPGSYPFGPCAMNTPNANAEDLDERERKRQKRKQSNMEAARKSRMRKQAEFDELAHRAESLKEENTSLRIELDRIKSEYQQLLCEYNSLKVKLDEVQQEIKEPDSQRKEQSFAKEKSSIKLEFDKQVETIKQHGQKAEPVS